MRFYYRPHTYPPMIEGTIPLLIKPCTHRKLRALARSHHRHTGAELHYIISHSIWRPEPFPLETIPKKDWPKPYSVWDDCLNVEDTLRLEIIATPAYRTPEEELTYLIETEFQHAGPSIWIDFLKEFVCPSKKTARS